MKQFEVGKTYRYTGNGMCCIGHLSFTVTARTTKTVTGITRLFGEITRRVTVVKGNSDEHESIKITKGVRITANDPKRHEFSIHTVEQAIKYINSGEYTPHLRADGYGYVLMLVPIDKNFQAEFYSISKEVFEGIKAQIEA